MKKYNVYLNGKLLVRILANHPSDFIHNIEIKRMYIKKGTICLGEIVPLKKVKQNGKKSNL